MKTRSVLRGEQIFAASGWLRREVPDWATRLDLMRRIEAFLSGRRGGSLRLPLRFPKTVRDLTNLTRSEIRDRIYWVKPSLSSRGAVDNRTSAFAHRVLPGAIWTQTNKNLSLTKEMDVARLSPLLHPGVSRRSWPSTPDIFEMMGMARTGRKSSALAKSVISTFGCLTRRQVNNDIHLASRIVARQVVGIRSGVGVPSRFAKYFRSYHDFLILTTRYSIPSGLVRFLISKWILAPTSLWLVDNCHFRIFLKRHFYRDFIPVGCVSRTALSRKRNVRVGSPYITDTDESSVLYMRQFHLHVMTSPSGMIVTRRWDLPKP